MEITKKEQTTHTYELEAINTLKWANTEKEYKGKTEVFKIKEINYPEEIFKIIIIKVGKAQLIFPMTKDEYDYYKKLEKEYWNVQEA